MEIKTSHLVRLIKQVVREEIELRGLERDLNEASPPGKKSERMIQHVKKSLRSTHPEWDEDKVSSVAIATAWKHHGSKRIEELRKTKPTDIETIVKLLLDKGIKDPEKIKQLASQLHLKQFDKPVDMDTVDQVIRRELPNYDGHPNIPSYNT